MSTSSTLSGLNDRQGRAAALTEGPLLIIAGAGAGKTKTLVSRIGYIIEQGTAPEHILAITFTNKAAREMRERVRETIRQTRNLNIPISGTETPFVSTFHALGVHILRANAKTLDLPKHFSILDRADSKAQMKTALERVGYDPKQYDPRKILGIISGAKGEGMDHDQFAANHRPSPMAEATVEAWPYYTKQLQEEGALDFDDLLLKTMQLLESNKEVREYYQRLWAYVHIDEYQDTNHVQYRIARVLAEPQQNICVVGDVDQTIYTWRGATIKNILTFEQDYPNAERVVLEENYRSTQTIIEAANQIIAKNQFRQEKMLFTNNAAGEPITRAEHPSETSEAGYIARKARERIDAGVPASEIAVLYRTNVQSRTLEEAFLAEGVPYQVLGTKFFDRKEVKHIISYIKAALNEQNISDFKRIVNVPTRGIGNATMAKMLAGQEEELTPKQQAAASSFRRILERIRESAGSQKPSEVVKDAITASGLDEYYKKQGTDEDEERRANMYELATLATKYDVYEDPSEGLEALLEDAALASDQDSISEQDETERVKLMTVHAAKGLEFDYVFITGLEEGLFPQDKDDAADQEEERRLFYVALTRARKKAYLTHAGMRTIFGQRYMQMPSVFLADIGEHLIEEEGPQRGGGENDSIGMLDDDPIVRIDW